MRFGLPTEDDGSRDDAMLGRNRSRTTHYKLDFDSLQKAVHADRCRHHGGFLGGEFGWAGDPDAFAPKLRERPAEAG